MAMNLMQSNSRRRSGFQIVNWGAILIFAVLSAFLLACDDSKSSEQGVLSDLGDNSCRFGLDGVCDEPTRCAFGTDDFDCQQACQAQSDAWRPFMAMACEYRLSGLGEQNFPSRASTPKLWQDRTLQAPTDDGTMIPRHYRVYRPSHLKDDPMHPLVLMLPGNRVSHYSLPEYTALEQSAETNGFVLVHVEQPWRDRTFSWSWYTDWDWQNDPDGNPDLIFLRALIDQLRIDENLMGNDVYVAGHSRGAAMSLIAALEMPDLIAGAVVQSGFVEFGYFERLETLSFEERKPRLYFMHGVIDDDVCIDCVPGGRCGVTPGRTCGTVASSDALVETLQSKGFDETFLAYARLGNVAHRWQPWLNHVWWSFLRPNASESDQFHGVFEPNEFEDNPVHAPLREIEEMVAIEAGSFMMGIAEDAMVNRYGDGWYVNEQPRHERTMDAFSVDPQEVSVKEYARFVQFGCGAGCFDERMPIRISDGQVSIDAEAADEPIRFVTRAEADAYCRWRGKRLLTEAEFERIAAGSEGHGYPWSRDGGPQCRDSNFSYEGGRCSNRLYAVGSRSTHVTSEGVFDLGGNVAEWVMDDFSAYPGSNLALETDGRFGLVRGGSFLTPRTFLQAKARLPILVQARSPDIGFRCAYDSTLNDPVGLVRGALPYPETFDGQGGGALDPAILTGLDQPKALIRNGEMLFVATKEGIVRVSEGMISDVLHEGEVDKWLSDGVHVWSLDLSAEEICEFSPQGLVACSALAGVVDAVFVAGQLIWSDGIAIYAFANNESELLQDQLTGLRSMAAAEGYVWVVQVGPDGPTLSRIALGDEVTEPEVFLGPEMIPSPLVIANVATTEEQIWMTVGFDNQWPYSALLCRLNIPTQRLSCPTHTPPQSSQLKVIEDEVIWRHQFGISKFGQSRPYENSVFGLSPGGLFIDEDGLWISARFKGEIWRMD